MDQDSLFVYSTQFASKSFKTGWKFGTKAWNPPNCSIFPSPHRGKALENRTNFGALRLKRRKKRTTSKRSAVPRPIRRSSDVRAHLNFSMSPGRHRVLRTAGLKFKPSYALTSDERRIEEIANSEIRVAVIQSAKKGAEMRSQGLGIKSD